MANNIQIWLEDIINAIDEIDSFVGKEMNFLLFRNDLKTRKAVERNIEIIGEAVNRICRERNDITISNSRRIIDTRNRIIHGYDTISGEIVWAIVVNELPKLRKEIETLLKIQNQ